MKKQKLLKLQPRIIFRLVLSKKLFKNAEELCSITNDEFSFSHGLITLHDALDNFLGAIVSHLSISLHGKKDYLLDMFNAVEKEEKKHNNNFTLISKTDIKQLNTLRVNIKHQGIIPNIQQSITLLSPIEDFFKKYSKLYFNLEWDTISLADLIENDSIKNGIKSVEGLMEKGKYKDALNKMAIIKFQVFDEGIYKIRLSPTYDFITPPSEEDKKLREGNNIFLQKNYFSDFYKRIDLLEKGINREIMSKFEDLTAQVGINNTKEWKYILKHGLNWGKPNWTKQNCLFCYNFLVDAIIKNQRKKYSYEEKVFSNVHTIEIKGGDLKIYHNKTNELIYTLKKGAKRKALIFDYIGGQWEDYGEKGIMVKLYKTDTDKDIIGYIKKEDKDKILFRSVKQRLYRY